MAVLLDSPRPEAIVFVPSAKHVKESPVKQKQNALHLAQKQLPLDVVNQVVLPSNHMKSI
jgi:hypothetical protein